MKVLILLGWAQSTVLTEWLLLLPECFFVTSAGFTKCVWNKWWNCLDSKSFPFLPYPIWILAVVSNLKVRLLCIINWINVNHKLSTSSPWLVQFVGYLGKIKPAFLSCLLISIYLSDVNLLHNLCLCRALFLILFSFSILFSLSFSFSRQTHSLAPFQFVKTLHFFPFISAYGKKTD